MSSVPSSNPSGTVWIAGEQLLYVDYFGQTRAITGLRRGEVTDKVSGELYLIAGQLRWISSGQAPYYEIAVTGTCSY